MKVVSFKGESMGLLQALTQSELQAAVFIKLYLEESGRRCFTYRGLRAWWSRERKYEGSEWHTVERAIRRLAEEGYLKRIRKRRHVIFCLEPSMLQLFEELEKVRVR